MTKDAGYGYFEITNQTRPGDSNLECSCGVVIWNVELHVKFHQLLGHAVTVEQEA